MTAHVSEDRLLDLAARLVQGADAEPWLAHLRDCPACEERFRGICRELERTRLAGAPAKRRLVATGAVAALAAAVLVAVVLIPLLRSRDVTDPVDYWLPVEVEAVGLRTAPPGVDESVFAEATDAYRRHDAARVVALLEGKSIPESFDPLRIFYASSLLKTGDAAGALSALETARIVLLPQPYRDRAKWVQIGALRALSRDAEASALASELAARPGEFSRAARTIGQSGRPTRKNPPQ